MKSAGFSRCVSVHLVGERLRRRSRPPRSGGRRTLCTTARLIAGVALLMSGCAPVARTSGRAASPGLYSVLLDGRTVAADPGSILDLLVRERSPLRLGVGAERAVDEPLVVVDGNWLDSVHRLRDIPAFHARSIVVLTPGEAVPAYGPRARRGAIIVVTKRGSSES